MLLTTAEVQRLRMHALLLAPLGVRPDGPTASSVADVVEWMGAMQAQDLASGQWSLGVRLPGLTVADVDAAMERKETLRTWPMRGTVHFVPPRDAHWMLDLMSPKPLANAAARRAFLGIDESVVERSNEALRNALAGGGRLTRAQCVAAIEAAGVSVAGQVAYHLLWYASQVGITCMAGNLGTEQTFVLLDEWVPDPVRLDRDEALATIALRYFRSHGPAPVKELARWTGMGVRDCRRGVEAAGDTLVVVATDTVEMVAAAEALDMPVGDQLESPTHLALPGFDEYMLGYGDRASIASPEVMAAVIPGKNGVFQSTLVRHGATVGLWKRTAKAKHIAVAARALEPLTASDRKAFEASLATYGDFMGKPVQVEWA